MAAKARHRASEKNFPRPRWALARPVEVIDRTAVLRCNRAFSPTYREHAMKRTYQPSKIRRARTHGFLVRMSTRGGRAVIRARRSKGRARLAV